MDLTALDQNIADLQTRLQFCNDEIAQFRVASSITDEYKRTINIELAGLQEAIEALQSVRALLVVLDGVKLSQAQADLLYAPAIGGGLMVKSGMLHLAAGGSVAVTFGAAFPIGVTPQVVVCSQFNTSDTSTTLCAHTVSNTGFTIRGAGNAAGHVAWIATSAGNA